MVGSQVPARLSYLLLTWVAAGILTKDQLVELYHRIFLIQQEGVIPVDDEFFEKTLQWLLEKKFLTVDLLGSQLKLTHSGRVVVKFAVSPSTLLFFRRIKFAIDQYPGIITLPELFIINMACEEFTNQLRVDSTTDQAALHNAEVFIQDGVLKAVFTNKSLTEKEADHVFRAIGAAKKGFAYVFNQFLAERYGGSNMTLPSGQLLHKIEIDPDAGDVASLKESALRIVGAFAAFYSFGKFKEEYPSPARRLGDGSTDV